MTNVKIVNNNASFFQEDPMLINELRDDVRDESSKFGEVKSVKLYDVSLAFCETIMPCMYFYHHFKAALAKIFIRKILCLKVEKRL